MINIIKKNKKKLQNKCHKSKSRTITTSSKIYKINPTNLRLLQIIWSISTSQMNIHKIPFRHQVMNPKKKKKSGEILEVLDLGEDAIRDGTLG